MVAVKKFYLSREELNREVLDKLLSKYKNVRIDFISENFVEIRAWGRRDRR